MLNFLLAFIPRAIVQGIPLLFGSTGEIVTEKSGNLNLGIPGVMYVGAICGVIGSFFYEHSVPDASAMNGTLAILIPMACSLFGIPNDIAMQVVGVGFIVGVIQDSCETGLNSSSDVVFTATAEYRQLIKEGKEVHLGKDSFAYHELS